jgi:hypothetical protein
MGRIRRDGIYSVIYWKNNQAFESDQAVQWKTEFARYSIFPPLFHMV